MLKQASALSRQSLLLVLTLILGGLALMNSEPPRAMAQDMYSDDDPGNDPRLEGRDHLVEASQSIRELVREKDFAGFTGIREEPNRLTLYWKGIVPHALDSLVSRLANEGTTVAVRTVRWSRKQFLAESQRLLEFANSSGIRVTQAGPTSDFSGIELVIDPADIGRAEREIRSSIRLELHAEASEIELVAGRWNDEPPFKAGAMMDCCSGAFGTNYEYCTLGFAVIHAGVVNAITAGHCAAAGTLWQTPEGDRLVGVNRSLSPNN